MYQTKRGMKMICTIISTGEELNILCKNEKEPPYPEIKSKLREKIWEIYCRGYNSFFMNCEYGVPLWCAEIISVMKIYNDIELHISMPYEEQATNWVEEFRERFFDIHAQADSSKIISHQFIPECYDMADEYMIKHSDLLLVVGTHPYRMYGEILQCQIMLILNI